MSSKVRLEYHIVLVTKYRKPVLAGLEDSVYSAVRHAAKRSKFTIISQAVDLGDHLHLVVSLPADVSVASMVNRLKQLTTLELWALHESTFRKSYWKRKRVLWSACYFANTVGEVSEETVLDYVRRQAK